MKGNMQVFICTVWTMNILGVSALYHDSAAALCHDGEVIAAAQEERFTRKKADASIPVNAIKYCLENCIGELDAVVYYDNPFLTLDRWLSGCVEVSPENLNLIKKTYPSMFGEKLWVHKLLEMAVGGLGKYGKLLVCEHHYSHAASAFYISPFEDAAFLTIDGVGEWATTTIGIGSGNSIKILEQLNYPNSLGLLYSAFTYFCGFKVNFGEYKLMGLAPYGKPIFSDLIMDKLIDLKEDGSFKLHTEYFSFTKENVMTGPEFEELFGITRREPETLITKPYMDLAASIQKVTEDIIVKLVVHCKEVTKQENLVLAGGTALNCVANGKIIRSKIFKNVWIQPAAGDAGGALGAALYASHSIFGEKRKISYPDGQKGTYLGPEFSNQEIQEFLDKNRYKYHYMEDETLYRYIAEQIYKNKVIGLFWGRMEYGPRALGNRSIVANPLSENMQSNLNLKIKFRESFRPFAPAVLEECAEEYFDIDTKSPYMLLTAPVKESLRFPNDDIHDDREEGGKIDLLKIVNRKRSSLPAITHVDYSARIQTVSKDTNPAFWKTINEFKKLSNYGVVINTSFNVRGEPIVCSPEDAYLCFMRTNMDILVLQNFVLLKEEQQELNEDADWRKLYELD